MGILGRLMGGLEVIKGDPKEEKVLGCEVRGARCDEGVTHIRGVRGHSRVLVRAAKIMIRSSLDGRT
jgi:hypothetical protein